MSIDQLLTKLFDAERAAYLAEEALLEKKPGELLTAVKRAVDEAFSLRDATETMLRLRRLAVLAGEVEGAEATDVLIRILGHDEAAVRVAALDELEARAYDRYAEFARGVDRALDGGASVNALLELPHLVAEVGEPSALLLLRRFLQHDDPEVVAEGIASVVELGDPAGIPVLQKLTTDPRVVSVTDEEGDDETQATVGELAREALEALEGEAED